jgi:hypothetical protein
MRPERGLRTSAQPQILGGLQRGCGLVSIAPKSIEGNQMKIIPALIGVSLLSLTACAPTPKVSSTRLAGSWESLHMMTAYKATGVDIHNEGAMLGKEMRDGPYCIGPEFAAIESLIDRAMEGRIVTLSDWKVIRSSFKNGKVDVALQLDIPDQDKILSQVTGTMTPSSTSLVQEIDIDRTGRPEGGGARLVHIVQTIEERRIGGCTPGQRQAGSKG